MSPQTDQVGKNRVAGSQVLVSSDEDHFGIHAGDMETSAMLALHPELVAMDHARDFGSLAAGDRKSVV